MDQIVNQAQNWSPCIVFLGQVYYIVIFFFWFLQSIPRVVWLDKNERQLVQWPVEEVESLRDRKVKLSDEVLEKGEPLEIAGITAEQVSVHLLFSIYRNA